LSSLLVRDSLGKTSINVSVGHGNTSDGTLVGDGPHYRVIDDRPADHRE
jgi:hypothetical protein